MILFSIIIPTYNRASFIKKSIDSVIAQDYEHWELIVVDDASTDDTPSILSSYSDRRIKLIRNEINIERSASRNKGIALAQGEYICFLDSDDYFLPHHLSSIAQAIQQASDPIALFHTGVLQVRGDQKDGIVVSRQIARNPVETVITCHVPVISVAIHYSIFKHYQFDPAMRINEDVYFFAQVATVYPLVYISDPSVVWVLHGDNTSDQEHDYLTPQLLATIKITQDQAIAPHLSRHFVRNKFYDLYTQLVYFKAYNRKPFKSCFYFFKGILISPTQKQNWTNLLNVIYHLPGGQGLKKIISALKSTAR